MGVSLAKIVRGGGIVPSGRSLAHRAGDESSCVAGKYRPRQAARCGYLPFLCWPDTLVRYIGHWRTGQSRMGSSVKSSSSTMRDFA